MPNAQAVSWYEMMSYASDEWSREVPGARWFKADLHLHTIDDLPGGRAKVPAGMDGSPDSKAGIRSYARIFLQRAAERQVRVLGITPHSPFVENAEYLSAVWQIVEEWRNGRDEHGTPFRDKIFAVFPGFEPSFCDGNRGLHLLFLFDPAIGKERFRKAFELLMGGVSPWKCNTLQLSRLNAKKGFRELREFHRSTRAAADGHGGHAWGYLVLAPHMESGKGLLGAQKAQVLQDFPHGEVAGLELADEKLPQEALTQREWLQGGMSEHHQWFFHGSDAYNIDEIGRRYTWLKLGKPTIEALRQAFIAHDSRVRIAYERTERGCLGEIATPPDVTAGAAPERPWLKSVTIVGGASFFRSNNADGSECRFELSPDLTCIIGGSMTGKSTFLDGLRMHTGAPVPRDPVLRKQVESRGCDVFLAGSPKITLECPGQDPTAQPNKRWPAVFFAQNELQRLAQEPAAVEEILSRLAEPKETEKIRDCEAELGSLDAELSTMARYLASLDEERAEAEQACERSRTASGQLAEFSAAGIDNLHRTSSLALRWKEFASDVNELAGNVSQAHESSDATVLPEVGEFVSADLKTQTTRGQRLRARRDRIGEHLRQAKELLKSERDEALEIVEAITAHETAVRSDVNRKLADRGLDGAKINEFQKLNRTASLLSSYKSNLAKTKASIGNSESAFKSFLEKRDGLTDRLRAAFDRVIETVYKTHGGRISVRRICGGNDESLSAFLKDLKRSGITRWWNGLVDSDHPPSPAELLTKFESDDLTAFGMSPTVQDAFRECLTSSMKRKLAAIRSADRYVIELRLDNGEFRPLDDLSGGQRISVLLSLLLETTDDRPLVIDQPEDELDNRFLSMNIIPALKRLKGHRQIIVATHNADIVVNGDADQVILLEASASQGRVAQAGAIEEPAIRNAIVQTVDGGDEAFRLRRLKYGF